MKSTLMNLINWCDSNKTTGFDIIRLYLGLGLLFRGVVFLIHPEIFEEYIQEIDSFIFSMALVHYVALAHLVGGLCLTVGLLTRLAALIQIPILFVAVFYINISKALLSSDSLELSTMVLFLLLIFSVFGSGPLSVDGYLKTHPNSDDD